MKTYAIALVFLALTAPLFASAATPDGYEFGRNGRNEVVCFAFVGTVRLGKIVDTAFCTRYGQNNNFEYQLSSLPGKEIRCYLQEDGRSVGQPADSSLCNKFGTMNSFEFSLQRGSQEIACFLERDGRPKGKSVDSSLCAYFGSRNSFEFAPTRGNEQGCFLRRNGVLVGESVDLSWCAITKFDQKIPFVTELNDGVPLQSHLNSSNAGAVVN